MNTKHFVNNCWSFMYNCLVWKVEEDENYCVPIVLVSFRLWWRWCSGICHDNNRFVLSDCRWCHYGCNLRNKSKGTSLRDIMFLLKHELTRLHVEPSSPIILRHLPLSERSCSMAQSSLCVQEHASKPSHLQKSPDKWPKHKIWYNNCHVHVFMENSL